MLRKHQVNALKALQKAVKDGKQRFLFEMATGTGKTLTSAAVIRLFLRSGNAIVTADFPVVALPNITEIDRQFLMIYFSSQMFFDAMQEKSKGTTNRVRTKKSEFLDNTVPWGNADERKRIVEEYLALCKKVEQMQKDASKIQDDIPVLTSKYLNK